MELNEQFIIDTNRKIKEDMKIMSRDNIYKKYKTFEEKYPKIFLSILDGVFDEKKLLELIDIRRRSFEKYRKNDYEYKKLKSNIDVGEYLARDFLYPTLGEPSSEEKQKAYRKVLEKTKYNSMKRK